MCVCFFLSLLALCVTAVSQQCHSSDAWRPSIGGRPGSSAKMGKPGVARHRTAALFIWKACLEVFYLFHQFDPQCSRLCWYIFTEKYRGPTAGLGQAALNAVLWSIMAFYWTKSQNSVPKFSVFAHSAKPGWNLQNSSHWSTWISASQSATLPALGPIDVFLVVVIGFGVVSEENAITKKKKNEKNKIWVKSLTPDNLGLFLQEN